MKKYEVYGSVTVYVTKEVWANSEEEAIEKAEYELPSLTGYAGNGSWDRLIGVENDGESIAASDDIDYDRSYVRLIENDPDYFECPDCGDQCVRETDADGVEYWFCDCGACWNDDCEEFYPEEEE